MLALVASPWSDEPAAVDVLAASGATPHSDPVTQIRDRVPAPDTGHEARVPLTAGAGLRLRTGSRKAVPVTRGQELGLRFRPDERDPYFGAPTFPSEPGRQTVFGADDPQFRPIPRRRKPTYEELQAEQAPRDPPAVGPVFPGIPPTLPPPPAGVFR